MDEESLKTRTARRQKTTNKHSKNDRLERLKVTIEKKKECNAKALEVVTKLSEETVDEACLIDKIRLISQEHYDDIVEERVLNGLCGYALCAQSLDRSAMPKHQFLISTVHNKVFDITHRKKFCSNVCYKASRFLGAQVPSSPVWLRDSSESLIISLLPLHTTKGIAGDEVDLGVKEPLKVEVDLITPGKETSKIEKLKERNSSTSQHSINVECEQPSSNEERYQCALADHKGSNSRSKCVSDSVTNIESDKDSGINSASSSNSPNHLDRENCSLETHSFSNLHVVALNHSSDGKKDDLNVNNLSDNKKDDLYVNRLSDSKKDDIDTTAAQNSSMDSNSVTNEQQTNDIGVKRIQNRTSTTNCDDKKGDKIEKKPSKSKSKDDKNKQNPASVMKNVVLKVEHTMKEWFTVETLCFILGEEKVKEILSEKHPSMSLPSPSHAHNAQFYERYLSICRKLNILEMEDSKLDSSFREECKKPLPDFEALRSEAEQMDLKVRMFYRGDKVQFSETAELGLGVVGEGEGVREPQVPLVDLHAQKALRRRILLDRLKRVFLDVQSSVGLKGFQLIEAVKAMVSTFTLSAHNVTLRPLEWNLVAIVIIKLLSLRDSALAAALDSGNSKKQLTLLLMSFSLDSLYLDRLITWLTEIDGLIAKRE